MVRDRYGWTLVVVSISAFMVTLDNTVTNVALTTLLKYFDKSLQAVSWVTTSYILIFSCLMIAGGRLVDVYGCRRIYTIGMSFFTLASLGAGLSEELSYLILFRVLQGAGAALALPATLVMVINKRTDKQKSIGNLVFIMTSTVASALGPTLGGLIIDAFSWHWIFLINVLPGLFVIVFGWFVLEGQNKSSPESVDLPAVFTSATLLFALTYGVHSTKELGWTHPSVLAVFALAALALGSFVLVEKWAPNPMLTTEFFRSRAFSGGLVGQILWGMGFTGVLTYAGNFMQYVLGWSASQAGTAFIPPAVIIGVCTPLGFWLAGRFGPRIPITTGMVLMSCGLFAFSRLHQGSTFVDMIPGMVLVGMGSSLTMPLGLYVLKAIPEERTGVAGGVLNVGREISAALGIVVLGAVLGALENDALARGSTSAEAMEKGSSVALTVGSCLVLCGALITVLTLQRRSDLREEEQTDAPPKTPDSPSLTSGSFPVIPDWWGTNRRSEIPSAWPPPPSYSPYEMSESGSSHSGTS